VEQYLIASLIGDGLFLGRPRELEWIGVDEAKKEP
jgi:hypothetical protein